MKKTKRTNQLVLARTMIRELSRRELEQTGGGGNLTRQLPTSSECAASDACPPTNRNC